MKILVSAILLLGITHLILLIIQLLKGRFAEKISSNVELKDIVYDNLKIATVIPVCDEPPHILKSTIEACKRNMPGIPVFIIENSTSEYYSKKIADVCKLELVECYSVPNRGSKAKALNDFLRVHWHLYDFFLFLDVDHQPLPGIIHSLMKHFHNDKVALVQSPQFFRNERTNLVTFSFSCLQTIYFEILCFYRNKIGFAVCNGTNFIVRSCVLKQVDFFDESTIIEDISTAFNISMNGYKIAFITDKLATGLAPTTIKSFTVPLRRYTVGNNQLSLIILKQIIKNRSSFYKLKISLLYLHSCLSLSIAGIVSFAILISLFFNSINFMLQISLAAMICFNIISFHDFSTHIKVSFGQIVFSIISPLLLIYSLKYFNRNIKYEITPKE